MPSDESSPKMILQTQFVTNYLHDSDQSLDAMHISRSVTLAQWSVKISKFIIITFIAVFQIVFFTTRFMTICCKHFNHQRQFSTAFLSHGQIFEELLQ